jgi:hypothetical protein
VPFSTSPALRKFFTRPAQTLCPSRIECSLCPAFRRLSFSRPSFPKTARVIRSVLVRSNNRRPSGPLRFACGPKPPANYFTRLAAASYRNSSLGFRFRVSGGARTPSVEPVNPASLPRGLRHRFKRDQTNQPGSIFPRSPGIILNRLVSTFISTNPLFFQ